MKYQVRLSPRAERDVDQVLNWLCTQGATAEGAKWLARLLLRIEVLELHPDRVRFADEANDVGIELRELLFGRGRGVYRILFQIRGKVVHILHVRHASRSSLSEGEI